MSPPAMKCVPAPRITTQRTFASFSNSAVCLIRRSVISNDSAFSDSGRLSVSQPMPSLTSARTCGADMPSPDFVRQSGDPDGFPRPVTITPRAVRKAGWRRGDRHPGSWPASRQARPSRHAASTCGRSRNGRPPRRRDRPARQMPALDRGARIVGTQRLDRLVGRDRIVGEAQPADRESDLLVVRPQRLAPGVANVVARAAPARPAARDVGRQVGGADPRAREAAGQRREARDQQPPQRQHAQAPTAGRPMPPMAALAGDQHGRAHRRDVVGEPQHLAAERMADDAERRAGMELAPDDRASRAGRSTAPLIDRRGRGLLRAADAAIVVGQHGEAAAREMGWRRRA